MKSKLERISRKDLAKGIAEKTGLSQDTLVTVMDAFLDEIKAQFYNGNMIELRGFGTFYPVHKKARSYTITRLKEKVHTKGRMTLRFKPSRQILIYE
jgi:nucleoid DNA-binding protein